MRTAGRTRIKLPAGRCHAVGWVGDNKCLEPDGVTHTPVTPISLTSNGSGKSHSVVPQGTAPSGDASESGPRSIAAQDDPTPFSGLAGHGAHTHGLPPGRRRARLPGPPP